MAMLEIRGLFSTYKITFSDIRWLILLRRKEEGGVGKAAQEVLANWISLFGAPDILLADNDARFIGKEFIRFCTDRKITLQTVTPGHIQILGSTEMSHRRFKETIHRINDNRTNRQIRPLGWQKYDALSMLHLNSKVQRYDCFTPGQRVFGRTHKLPIGTARNPNYSDFTHTKDDPVTQTHQVLAKLIELREASLESDFDGKFNIALNHRVRDMGSEESLLWQTVYRCQEMGEIKRILNGMGRVSL